MTSLIELKNYQDSLITKDTDLKIVADDTPTGLCLEFVTKQDSLRTIVIDRCLSNLDLLENIVKDSNNIIKRELVLLKIGDIASLTNIISELYKLNNLSKNSMDKCNHLLDSITTINNNKEKVLIDEYNKVLSDDSEFQKLSTRLYPDTKKILLNFEDNLNSLNKNSNLYTNWNPTFRLSETESKMIHLRLMHFGCADKLAINTNYSLKPMELLIELGNQSSLENSLNLENTKLELLSLLYRDIFMVNQCLKERSDDAEHITKIVKGDSRWFTTALRDIRNNSLSIFLSILLSVLVSWVIRTFLPS